LCGTAAASAALDCNGDRLFSLHIWFRSWTTAMMCRTRLMRRLPALDSRWGAWLPEDASSGAVPFQEANRSRLAARAEPCVACHHPSTPR
jgi:hypothetical protein